MKEIIVKFCNRPSTIRYTIDILSLVLQDINTESVIDAETGECIALTKDGKLWINASYLDNVD